MLKQLLSLIVAPTAPRDLSVEITASTMWTKIHYKRPLDDGGTSLLSGNTKLCFVDRPEKLRDCRNKRFTDFENHNTRWVSFILEEQTDYYVEIQFESKATQWGPAEGLFFTTPKKCMIPYCILIFTLKPENSNKRDFSISI